MKRLGVCLTFLVLLGCGDIESVKPEDTFIKFFGKTKSIELIDMCLTNEGDGGVIMVGNVSPALSGLDTAIYIMKIDGKGNLVQEYELLESSNALNSTISGIVPISEGYLLVGSETRGKLSGNEIKGIIYTELDNDLTPVVLSDFYAKDGNALSIIGEGPFVEENKDSFHVPLWTSIYDMDTDFANYYGVDIDVTQDGGILVAGYTDLHGDNDFFYSKIGGTTDEWSRIQRRVGSDDRLTGIAKFQNTHVLIGQTEALSDDGEGGINIERTVIDADGVIANSFIFGITGSIAPISKNRDDIPLDIVSIPRGFAIVGKSSSGSSSFPFLSMVDMIGASSQEIIYESLGNEDQTPGYQGFASSVAIGVTNQPIIVGQLADFEGKSGEVMLLRTDNDGSTMLEDLHNFGLVNGDDVGKKVLIAPDGSILVGATYDFGGGIYQFALLKFNNDLELKK